MFRIRRSINTIALAGSTKASIQAVLSPQPVPATVVTTATSEAAEYEIESSPAERYYFDPVDTGSFPPKPALSKTIDGVHGSQSKTFAPTESAIQTAVEQTGKSSNDARALDMPFKHNRALPLELFDNPETEVVPPEDRIKGRADGQPGALARSRFYDSRGEFAWAPCFVLAYDRYKPHLIKTSTEDESCRACVKCVMQLQSLHAYSAACIGQLASCVHGH